MSAKSAVTDVSHPLSHPIHPHLLSHPSTLSSLFPPQPSHPQTPSAFTSPTFTLPLSIAPYCVSLLLLLSTLQHIMTEIGAVFFPLFSLQLLRFLHVVTGSEGIWMRRKEVSILSTYTRNWQGVELSWLLLLLLCFPLDCRHTAATHPQFCFRGLAVQLWFRAGFEIWHWMTNRKLGLGKF